MNKHEEIYQFNSAIEAMDFLRYYLVENQIDTILSYFITNLQRSQVIMNMDIQDLQNRIHE